MRWQRSPTITLSGLALAAAACVGRIGEAPGRAAGALPMAGPGPGAAPACAAQNVAPLQYLRQLSISLRGRPPTMDEIEQVQRDGQVTDALIDRLLHAPEFTQQVGQWHRRLIWPSLNGYFFTTTNLFAWDFDPATGRPAVTSGQSLSSRVFSPEPELTDNVASHPNAVVFMGGPSDRPLRGSSDNSSAEGCDASLEYPEPAPAGATQPHYDTTGTDGVTRSYPYYDEHGATLPYHDWRHCPNLCTDVASMADQPGRLPTSVNRNDPSHYHAMDEDGPPGGPVFELDVPGKHCPASHPYRLVNACDNALYDNYAEAAIVRREGFRWMTHYWSQGRPVRTCAYEAQQRETSAYDPTQTCAGRQFSDSSCGCGPQGAYCMPSGGVAAEQFNVPSRAQYRLRNALNDEPIQIIASVVAHDRDYLEIFSSRRSLVNGPLSFFWRHQLDALRHYLINDGTTIPLGLPAARDQIPALDYAAATDWREYDRGPEHAGILTTAAFLGRFPTFRARVARFRAAFMCRPLAPVTTSLPSPEDACNHEPNLARRCGCQGCHTTLEPMGAWFGRWAQRTTVYLPPDRYPLVNPACRACVHQNAMGEYYHDYCPPECAQYVLEPGELSPDSIGLLTSAVYRSPEEARRLDEGPAGMVAAAQASGELESCAARNAFASLMGREMTEQELRAVLPALVARFTAAGRNYRELVRAIVTSEAYRRVD